MMKPMGLCANPAAEMAEPYFSQNSESYWFCIRSKPRREKVAVASLQAKGFITFFPVFEEIKPDRHRAIRPLFPNYIFVYYSPDQYWANAAKLKGVSRILTYYPAESSFPQPSLVKNSLIEDIKRMCGEIGKSQNSYNKINVGTKVRITKGPFKHLEGVCLSKVDAGQRVRLLLSIFQRETEATFYVSDLEVV